MDIGSTDIVTTLISGWALLAVAIIGIATRYLNAYLTSPDAPDWITGGLAAVLSGLGALAAYLTDVQGAGTWQGALAVFAGGLTATQIVKAADLGLEPVLKNTKGGLSPVPAAGGGLDQGEAAGAPTGGAGTANPFAGVDPATVANIEAHPKEFVQWSDAPQADRDKMMNLGDPDIKLPE